MQVKPELEAFEAAIQRRLSYNPDTGVFIWLEPKREDFATLNAFTSWRTRWTGKEAGKLRPDGYVSFRITVDGVGTSFLAHRAAWLLSHGAWPPGHIDHINGLRADNRIHNLRAVTHAENQRNQKCDARSKTGVRGVTWSKHAKRWLVRINIGTRTKNLGYYLDFDEAVRVRRDAEKKHDYFAEHGKRARPDAEISTVYIARREQQRIRHHPK